MACSAVTIRPMPPFCARCRMPTSMARRRSSFAPTRKKSSERSTRLRSVVQEAVDDLPRQTPSSKIEKPSLDRSTAHAASRSTTSPSEIKTTPPAIRRASSIRCWASTAAATRANRATIPVLHMPPRCRSSRSIQAALGTDLAKLERRNRHTGPRRTAASWPAGGSSGETDIDPHANRREKRAGRIEGDGPHADETIVIGAHYDHWATAASVRSPRLARHPPGADDNGSGTAPCWKSPGGLSARSKEQPLPRRILFMSFTGEERGCWAAPAMSAIR